MDYFPTKRLFDMHKLTTQFPNLLSDTIRYPPNVHAPSGLVDTPRLNEKLSNDAASLNPKLDDFVQMYQQMATNLLNMSLDKLIPPGHPMYSKENSIALLKEENEKILKENFELKKRLQSKNEFKKI